MKKNLILLAMAVVAMASCSKNEAVEQPTTDANAISFGTFVGNQTKASAKTSFVATDVFVVSANRTSGTWEADKATSTPNFMYEQAVTKGDTDWTYTPVKYWPFEGKVSFFAYSPNTAKAVASANTVQGAPTITYTVADAVAEQEDLLANAQIDKIKGTEVKFAFDHLLSKIGFTASTSEVLATETTVKVNTLTIDYVASKVKNSGEYNLGTNALTLGTTTFHTASAGSVLTTANTAVTGTATDLTTVGSDKFLMLLPQTVEAGALTATINYTLTTTDAALDGGTFVSTIEKTIDLPAITWEMGKQYTYNLVLSVDKVVFDEPTFAAWTNGTQPAGTPVPATTPAE